MKVLVSTDDIETLKNAKLYFQYRHELTIAKSQQEAEERFVSSLYDLVLYDVGFLMTKGHFSHDTFHKLKKSPRHGRIIVLSDPDQIQITLRLLEIGADDFLTLPVCLDDLQQVTEKSLLQKRVESWFRRRALWPRCVRLL